jgi:FtsH-binding integral membrane protein
MNEPPVMTPPLPRMIDYPASIGVVIAIAMTGVMLALIHYFDPTGGPLGISVLVVVCFLGVVVFCSFFTLPTSEITSSVIGGLTAAFGAIIAYWLGKGKDGE